MIKYFKTFPSLQQFFIALFCFGGLITLVSLRHFTVALLWSIGVTLTILCQDKKEFLQDLWRALKHPGFLILYALLGWALFSSFWSLNPLQSIKATLSQGMTLILVAVFFTHFRAFDHKAFAFMVKILTGLVLISAVLLLIQMPPFFDTFKNTLGYGWSTLKPNVALVLTLSLPLAAYWHLHHRKKMIPLVLGLTAVLLVHQTSYQAGLVGLMVAGIAAGLSYRFSYFIPLASAYLSAFLCLTLPLIFSYIIPLMDLKALWLTKNMSSLAHRFYIWDFLLKFIGEKPLFGWGAEAARGFPTGGLKVFDGTDILPSHPHDHIMQVWLELGGVGALILAVLHFMLFRAIAQLESRRATAWAMLFSITSFVILSLSHSIWHKWWMTWLGVAGVLMVVVLKRCKRV